MEFQGNERITCRISGEPLVPLFDLGSLYMSDFIPRDSSPRIPQVPLKLCLAPESGLVQLAHTAPSDDMYSTYWYRSGTNATMTKELQDIAQSAHKVMRLGEGDIWVDIGCNDGTLLSFIDPSVTRIGIDPAKNGYKELSEKHAHVIVSDYFSKNSFEKTGYGDKKATVITSIAMFYDLEHPHDFVKDIEEVLDDNGLWILQMSYLPLQLKQLAFDNICHEHLEYYTLHSLEYLLKSHGLVVVDCQLNDINGGSFRVYVRKAKADPTTFATAPYRDVAMMRVESIRANEEKLDLRNPETYKTHFKEISALKEQTVAFIKAEKAKGKKIWGYGASTKGNTLLQWFGLDETLIDGIAERSPAKFGLKTAGSNIPIASEEEMRAAKPDYLLVLPWHFIAEFRRREQDYLKNGGAFIVPCPAFEVIRD
jgi:hypothetical protein